MGNDSAALLVQRCGAGALRRRSGGGSGGGVKVHSVERVAQWCKSGKHTRKQSTDKHHMKTLQAPFQLSSAVPPRA